MEASSLTAKLESMQILFGRQTKGPDEHILMLPFV